MNLMSTDLSKSVRTDNISVKWQSIFNLEGTIWKWRMPTH